MSGALLFVASGALCNVIKLVKGVLGASVVRRGALATAPRD